ncbi:MAG: Ig-like domain-containing protein, partial [Verrucomicrobiota bacterium]
SGTHTITAHAIDDRGALSVSSGVSVQINTPPVVVLTSPVDQARFPAGATIPLAATATDASGTIVRVEFFDGAAKIGEATAAPFELAWSNASGGVHSLTALATNSLNASATSAPVSITVNSAPQVSAGPDQDVILPAAATLSGTVNDDGLPEGTPLSLTWSRVSGPGAVTFGSSNAAVSTAAFSAPGVYLLRLTAGDGELSASDDIAVTVRFANRTPVTQDKSIQTPEDQPANVVLTATDADGDPLTFTVLTPPLHGTLDGTGAALLYKPAANYHGADQFFYKASDGRVDSAAAKVSIVVTSVNDAPVPHSPSLEVLLGQALPVTLSATDADGDALQFVVISQPTHGTLSGTAPDLVYTSRPDSPGHDQFLFTVSDGIAGAVQGQVSIDVRLSDTSPRSRTYTSRIDFEEGQLGQVVADPAGFLETKATQSDFDFVWIPVFTKNTVVRLDTETGRALGEYRTTPEGIGSAYASRTAIDVRGNVWIANERDNSVVMIANPDGPDWVDRNHNGRLDTSTGLGDVKPWGNGNGTDHNGGTTTAADELIVRYIRTAIKEPRHLSIDNNNNLWVGGGTVPDFDLISAISGEVLRHEPSIGRGGNGGFIDLHGVLWSTGSFLRWDTRRPLSTVPADSWNLEPAGWWATAKDSKGNLWVTRDPSTTVQKYNSQGALIGSFVHGDYWSQGIAIDQDDHVWIAHSHCGQSVGHLRPDGTFVGNVATAVHGPTGVSVDRKGRIWVSSTTGVVQRINPLAGEIGADGQTPVGEVDLTTPYLGGTLWTYANFTGNAASISGARGRWSFVYDSYLDDSAWDKAVWNADIYNDGSLTVTAAPTNNPIGIAEMRPLPIGTAPAGTGRYLLVNVDFDSGEDGLSPVLYDLTVGTLGYEVPVPLVDWNINAGKDFSATWPDALQIRAGVSRTAAMEGIVEPQLTWSQVSGPGVVGFDDAHKLRPKTQFSVPGVYTLRVTAVFNGQTKSDDVVISLSPRNKSPWASAGENRSIRSSADTLTLHGITRDDGLPSGAPFTSQWKKK